jgi:hypothetical protein
MGLFDKLFGRKRQDTEAPTADMDASRLMDRLGPTPVGSGDPRSVIAPPARSSPPPRAAVRLRAIVPIPVDRPWRSWLGGNPRLPDPFAWPHGDGKPFHFLAQVDCSELPEGLWQGAGPRRGWLAFFVGTRKGYVAVDVLHAPTLGPERPALAPWRRDDLKLIYTDAPDDWHFEPPAWPVEVLVQRDGDPEIWRSVFQRHGTAEAPGPYRDEVIDLARAEYQPHDWKALRALVHVMREPIAGRKENARRRLQAAIDAQNAPPPEQQVPATVHAEAVAAAERFAALEAALEWEPQLWVPYAQATVRWRTMLLQRDMERGVPLPTVAGQLWHYATAIIRAVPAYGPYAVNRPGPADPKAYQRVRALQPEHRARVDAMMADQRLPPTTVGEGGAKRPNEEGYRAFRAEQPELWAEYANRLRESFAELATIETALRLSKKPDPFGIPVSTYSYSHDWPQSRDQAAALLREWVATAERNVAWAKAPQPDQSPKVAAARAEIAEIEAIESALDSLAGKAADAEASGATLAWEEWRPQVEELLATSILQRSASGLLLTWNQLRSALAAHAYARNPAAPALPAPVLAYFLERWRYEAGFEMACMGGTSQGYTDIADPEDEDRTALLLELPESTLFGWSWGDVENLVVAMPIDALRRGDFSKVVSGVTNGGR